MTCGRPRPLSGSTPLWTPWQRLCRRSWPLWRALRSSSLGWDCLGCGTVPRSSRACLDSFRQCKASAGSRSCWTLARHIASSAHVWRWRSACRRPGSPGEGAVPPTPGAVEVAPGALGPARAGSGPSGGLGRRGFERELTPAAERSRSPPPESTRRGQKAGPGRSPSEGLTWHCRAFDAPCRVGPLASRPCRGQPR
jgi:hypothetical protein